MDLTELLRQINGEQLTSESDFLVRKKHTRKGTRTTDQLI